MALPFSLLTLFQTSSPAFATAVLQADQLECAAYLNSGATKQTGRFGLYEVPRAFTTTFGGARFIVMLRHRHPVGTSYMEIMYQPVHDPRDGADLKNVTAQRLRIARVEHDIVQSSGLIAGEGPSSLRLVAIVTAVRDVLKSPGLVPPQVQPETLAQIRNGWAFWRWRDAKYFVIHWPIGLPGAGRARFEAFVYDDVPRVGGAAGRPGLLTIDTRIDGPNATYVHVGTVVARPDGVVVQAGLIDPRGQIRQLLDRGNVMLKLERHPAD